MQSIETKFFGASNSRGSHIKATSSSGQSVRFAYDHALDVEENHHSAAVALARKLGWTGRLVSGGGRKGHGNVYVFMPKSARETIHIEKWKSRRSDPARRATRTRRRAPARGRSRRDPGKAAHVRVPSKNIYWSALPKNAHVVMGGVSGKVYVATLANGTKAMPYWGGQDAVRAQTFLNARVRASAGRR